MPKNILVPLDGSPVGESALPYAQVLARRSGAKLTLLRAAHAYGGPMSSAVEQGRAVEAAEHYLTTIAAAIAEPGLVVETAVPYGDPNTWIPEEVELRSIDLVVMATHNRSGPERWLRGSVGEAVVNHASVPVVVVRAREPGRSSVGFETLRPTLVVPLDGSAFAEAALPIARDFVTLLKGRLVLVGVVPDPSRFVAAEGMVVGYVNDDPASQEAETRDYLAAIVGRVGLDPATEIVVRVGSAATEIAMEADDRSAAAVVMATHGRTGVVRTILGSVAGGVLHGSAAPVILIRPSNLSTSKAVIPATASVAAPLPA
jgi:nucleotide-binding universal stress UspA family protein